MSTSLIDRYNDATAEETFRKRALMALVEAAVGNVGEAVGSIAADKRTAFARAVIADPTGQLAAVMFLIVADGTDENTSDTALRTRVGNLWNAFSGVRGGE